MSKRRSEKINEIKNKRFSKILLCLHVQQKSVNKDEMDT